MAYCKFVPYSVTGFERAEIQERLTQSLLQMSGISRRKRKRET